MKKTDLFIKRFTSVCLGISALLLSGSIFIFSLKTISTTQAKPVSDKEINSGVNGINMNIPLSGKQAIQADTTGNIQAVQAFGLGMRDGVIYFGILYNNNTVGLHKTEFNSEDILHW